MTIGTKCSTFDTGLDVEEGLAEIHELVLEMFSIVSGSLAAVTAAFLDGDRTRAEEVVGRDGELDERQRELERMVEHRLLTSTSLDRTELRLLIGVLRIAPELERSGDLIELIALRTQQQLGRGVSAGSRALVSEMGRLTSIMWRRVTDSFADRDPHAADQLRRLDDEIDELHVELITALAAEPLPVAVAIQMGLVARFYERLGDHAVNVARRIRDDLSG